MNLEKQIRKLARSFYWQTLYNASKENQGIKLFNNESNFSFIQIRFLHWLKIYSMLYEELSEQHWENLNRKIIEDDMRCDAFLTWRGKQIDRQNFKLREDRRKMQNKNKSKGTSYKIYQGPTNKNKEVDK